MLHLRSVIGLGSNLGDRLATLRAAVVGISRVARIEQVSHVYETAPVGGPEQPDYLNAAALIRFEGTAESLLEALQGIELLHGRQRNERWAARTIDLDVLWIEGLAFESEALTVPHPRLTQRAFALRPLIDVVPDAVDPETGLPYARLPAAGDLGVRLTEMSLVGAS